MTFEDFARAHGLVINQAIHNRWVATPTTDHPHKRNGRYKLIGDIGWVQNWATMEGPAMWKSDKPVAIRPVMIKDDRAELAAKAAKKAAWILNQCELKAHPYLEKKGFPNDRGNVWETEGKSLLVIPMRMAGRLVGCQMISAEGEKKFLYGQATKGAAFMIDAKGIPIFCEGYATALSIRAVMQAINMRYTIYCCFSAGNMKEVARSIVGGIVIADNDASGTGERFALEIGKPYWLAPTTGHDFNDAHQVEGVFHVSQSLKKVLINATRVSVENGPQSA
jgi:putative DNA primase/helicase